MAMENGGESLIKLDNVSKVFVTDEVETHALAGIHFDVKKGEYLAIAGPSGCGKSTLLAILGLLDTPSDGAYYLNGKPVTGLKMSERARIRNREIGFIFQAFILLADEPTGNLDSGNGEAVMGLLRELHQTGSTVCMVTHDPRYAEFADRTIRLFDGRIVEESREA